MKVFRFIAGIMSEDANDRLLNRSPRKVTCGSPYTDDVIPCGESDMELGEAILLTYQSSFSR